MLKFDRTRFFAGVHALFPKITQSQVEGCNQILAAAESYGVTDKRWLAYMLGTTYHETARTMQPIEEYGHGRGRAYGAPAGPWHQIYDGRGDVQLTWIANYTKANIKLHALGVLKPNESMIENPKLAMRPDVAATVMLSGMVEGWFTGKKLSEYFSPHGADWLGARRIINGQDCAKEIEGYALHFNTALVPAISATPIVSAGA